MLAKIACRWYQKQEQAALARKAMSILHYLDTAGELNHLLGLAVLQAIDTGNTVSDGQDTTGLLDINGRVEAADAVLEDRGDLGGGYYSSKKIWGV